MLLHSLWKVLHLIKIKIEYKMAGKYIFAFLVAAVFAGGVEAQVGVPCHADIFQFTPRHSLNVSEYMGNWYMQEIAGSNIGNFPAPDYKCATRSLSLPNGTDITQVSAVDTFVNVTSGASIVETSAVNVNNTRSPYTSMWYMTTGTVETDVIILSADLEFKQWTVVYSCAILAPDSYRYETVTALTRSQTIEPELRQFLKALMVGVGFRIGDHHPIDQTNCE
ncbi:hypothetical protein Ocin01_06934 [Orchesella cincta]|uniref:Apolipoprotein D n=1 Tax=Orchesella cincta TaxID=48709 RepID=A0A1D2N3V7_ORCCI|nr:hypothetical protein Ocin01_06934 [Orchesella cincta]